MTEQKKGMSKGCLVLLIIGIILVVIVVAMSVVCYVYKDDLVEMGLNKMTETIVTELKANLPDGISEEEVDKVVEEFKVAFKEGKIDQGEIQQISTLLQSALEDKEIDEEEGRKILETFKKAIE
jgi:actin-like ATPase involved in cell morphogenesis